MRKTCEKAIASDDDEDEVAKRFLLFFSNWIEELLPSPFCCVHRHSTHSLGIRNARFHRQWTMFSINSRLFARWLYYIYFLNRNDSSRKNYQSNLIVEWVLETFFALCLWSDSFSSSNHNFAGVFLCCYCSICFPISFLPLPSLFWLIAWVKFFSLRRAFFTSPSPRKKPFFMKCHKLMGFLWWRTIKRSRWLSFFAVVSDKKKWFTARNLILDRGEKFISFMFYDRDDD